MGRRPLYLMLPPATYGMIDLGDEVQQDRLVDMCAALSPELVVVDSLSAISVRGENNVEDVRALLGFLTGVAREFFCGLLLIHRLRKRGIVGLSDPVGRTTFAARAIVPPWPEPCWPCRWCRPASSPTATAPGAWM